MVHRTVFKIAFVGNEEKSLNFLSQKFPKLWIIKITVKFGCYSRPEIYEVELF